MGIKIRKKGMINRIIIFIMLMVGFHCFYLFEYPDVLKNITWSYNWSIIVVIISFWGFILKKKKKCWVNRYLYFLTLVILIEIVYTSFNYPNQKLFETFRVGCTFLFLFSTILFQEYMQNNGTEKLIKIISYCCFIWQILIIIESFFYTKGILLFDFSSYFYGDLVYERNKTIRMGIGILSEFMLIFNFSNYFSNHGIRKKEQLRSLIMFIVALYALFFIDQSRANEVYVLLTIMIIILIGSKSLKARLITIFVVGGIIFVTTSTNIVDNFIDSFSSIGQYSNGTTHRLYALEYYTQCIIKNPILGNGILKTTNIADPYYSVEHGTLGVAYYSDLGIVGLLANVGIIGTIGIYIIPMVRMGKCLIRLVKKYTLNKYIFPVAIYIYILISSGTLISTDVQRILQFSFVIAYIEYLYKKDYVDVNCN